ncbi:MAG: hypothetical protein ACKOKH_07155, partial [Bacteroidota bacterium]
KVKGTDRSQAKAWAFSLLLHLILVLILGLLTLGIPQNDPAENKAGGMALALGVPDGLAGADPSVNSSSEQSAETALPEPKPDPANPKSPPVATQDLEEAPVVNTKTSPPAETKPMDPRLQRLLNSKNSANQSSKQSPSQGVEEGSPESTGQSNGSGGFSASGDGLENRGFAQVPDPEEFRILDAQVDIPIEVDREGRVRVTGKPKSTKPITAQQRRALVEATQKARFKRNDNGKEVQRGILKYELKIRNKK